jgi:PAS domain-containing protein
MPQKPELMLLHAILDNPQISVISTGPDGKIQTFNRGAENLLGYGAEEVIGKVTPEAVHDAEEVRQRAAELTAEFGVAVEPGMGSFVTKATITGAPEVREWTYIRKDGGRLRMVLEVSILRDEQGMMQGYVGVAMQVPDWDQNRERRKAAAT